LVIGLVLPGCTPSENLEPVRYVFEGGKINIGIAGELNQTAGAMQWTGATLAQEAINRNGGVDIGGVSYILELVPIETGEETVDPTGLTGVLNLTAATDDVDFILGGFRTEAVEVYRDVAMNASKIFINCGAATEALQHSVVDDYVGYRFWFKGTPYNEYFLGQSVVRMLGAVAMKLREGMGVAANYTLNAAIIADNLAWAYEQVVNIKELLGGINVNLVHDPYWVEATGGTIEMQNVLALIAGLDPQFIIPIFSADAGVLYDMLRGSYVPNAMSVGINVMAQLKIPWVANLGHAPGGNSTLPYCAYEVILDNWAEDLNQTSKTAAFLTAFMNSTSGEYPLYTAATYDALFDLKKAIEAVAWYDAEKGVAYAWVDDIIKRLEDPTNAQMTTTGNTTYYPRPGTTAAGKPALTEAQVRSLYDLDSYNYTYTYNARDWTMPAHTTHDLVYGPGRLTGIGAQWQWDAMAGQWKKVGVWPMDFGDEYDAVLTDQYGCWNFAYNGTKALVIPQNVIDHHKP
jgi:branched-chain amino acid transport system substrate-binding protein